VLFHQGFGTLSTLCLPTLIGGFAPAAPGGQGARSAPSGPALDGRRSGRERFGFVGRRPHFRSPIHPHDSRKTHIFQAPWYAFFPGVSIFVLVFALNLIGDGLRDVFDPHRHNR